MNLRRPDEEIATANESAARLARSGLDDDLLRQCRWEAFRAGGPGGQKRNKTSSAIRITHLGTGISTIANESRKQSVNRAAALARLRHRMTIQVRLPTDVAQFMAPEWFMEKRAAKGRFRFVYRRGVDLPVLGLVLDVLASTGWSVADAARMLGLSTSALSGAIYDDPEAWAEVNQRRIALGLCSLR